MSDPIISAINEADEWLADHRVSESWRVINRLRDALTRAQTDVERAVREQIARDIEADRLRRAPNHFHHTHSGDIAFGVDCGMEQAAHIARGES